MKISNVLNDYFISIGINISTEDSFNDISSSEINISKDSIFLNPITSEEITELHTKIILYSMKMIYLIIYLQKYLNLLPSHFF